MKKLAMDYKCIKCILNRYSNVDKLPLTDENKTLYLKELLKIISESPASTSGPELVEKLTTLQNKYNVKAIDFSEIKTRFNSLMLSLEDKLWNDIITAPDSLWLAVSYAFTGNYIDFGALSDISEEKLYSLILDAKNVSLNKDEFLNFKNELSSCKRLVYLTDNCGEIVLDKLLIKFLKKTYPHLTIDVIVRGNDVLNDATAHDAQYVGLDKITSVTSNGTGIAGTVLNRINAESLALIHNADLIISKGMGNFETLRGADLNIYYMFLCKCDKFCDIFDVPLFTYMFLNEKRIETE